MQVIKSVEQLPEWFKSTKYKSNLGAIDWYREIRKREWVSEQIAMAVEDPDMPRNRPLTLFRACYKTLKPNWEVYFQYGFDSPLRDMTQAEAIFLSASNDSENARLFYKAAIELISHYRSDLDHGLKAATFEYQDHLERFLDDWHNSDYPGLQDMAYRKVREQGNPMLDYCRPFQGYPIIVDTAFDDETVVVEFKRWLAEVRKHDEPKARRPYGDNDFSDWTNYRVREIHDLDLWSSLTGTKIQDRVMAQALWPNAPDSFSPLDVLRTTARRKSKELFSTHVSQRFYGQLVFEFGENFLND